MLLFSIQPSYIGITAGVLTAASLLPQLIKLIREKKAEDISVMMLIILFSGLVLWICYGVMKDDWILIATNAFSLIINVLITVLTIKYKK